MHCVVCCTERHADGHVDVATASGVEAAARRRRRKKKENGQPSGEYSNGTNTLGKSISERDPFTCADRDLVMSSGCCRVCVQWGLPQCLRG